MKTLSVVAGLAMFVSLAAWGAPPTRVPFLYQEGFEGDSPTFTKWAANGEAEILFSGPTTEKAFSGTHSYKLEIVLKSGSYYYYGVPMSVACDGKLQMSARVWVGDETTARVGFGTNMEYPPTRHSGCRSESFPKPTKGWKLTTGDLVERGQTGADSVLRRHTTHLTGKNAGAVLDRWSLFIYGKKGDRAVVYVDDVELKGEVPERKAYEGWIAQRLDAAKAEFLKQVEVWEKELAALADKLPQAVANPALQPLLDYLQEQVTDAQALLVILRKQGYARQDKVDAVQAALARLRNGPENLVFMGQALATDRPFAMVAIENPMTDSRARPDLPPFDAPLSKGLKLTACRGEFESASAAVFAIKPVRGLRAKVTPLTGPAGTIPASAMDLRLVKWWYQGEGGIGYSPKRVLKAELLLKDAALVRVDTAKQENYLRHTAPDGTTSYRLCSGETSENLAGIRPIDARKLQPIDVAAGTSQEFWLNIHVPANAAPGTYTGQLVFTADGESSVMPLRLAVLPFDLPQSPLTYSIYYRAKLSDDGQPTITSERRSEQQYRAEIADMRDHGVLHPTNYQSNANPDAIRKILEIRRDLGLPTDAFYNLGQGTGSTTDPAQIAALRSKVKAWVSLCREFGYKDVYFYGVDEARDDRLKGQRLTWKAVQDAGGKTFVACYMKTFEAMGALLNCAILARRPNPDEAKKWHSVGSTIFCYAYPQVGEEKPATYRRNFGLLLWQAGYDGAMDYAYQHGFDHVWNDFDSRKYRDHNFTYPTVDGIVGTLAWEGFREAVDDVRYVTALQDAIRKAGGAPQAKQAAQWLAGLDPEHCDLVATRAQVVKWIAALSGK